MYKRQVKALGLLAMGSGLIISAASAAINLTPVTLIIEDVTLLFAPLVAVVIAAVPINSHRSVLAVGDHDCAGDCRIHLGFV